jgi:hypothetical protein
VTAEDKLMWKFTAFAACILAGVVAVALWAAMKLP